jgi:hypothetical protein
MPVGLHKKLRIDKEEFKTLLYDMYYNQNLSQSKIAQKLVCSISCIEKWCKYFDFNGRSPSECTRLWKNKSISFSPVEKEVLYGLLLSDLHLECTGYQSRASFGFKYLEMANEIISKTESLLWSLPKYNKKTLGWHSRTRSSLQLKDEQTKWYKDKIKFIPQDLILTPITVLWWWLGDGTKHQEKNGATYGGYFCTEAFTKGDNERLVILLDKEGISSHLTPNNRIRIEGKNGFLSLLKYIGPSPVKCYSYKWDKNHEE